MARMPFRIAVLPPGDVPAFLVEVAKVHLIDRKWRQDVMDLGPGGILVLTLAHL
jgi:hypothetical protein